MEFQIVPGDCEGFLPQYLRADALSNQLLPALFGLDGIWWAMTVAEVFALGQSILFLATQRRRYHYL